MSKEFLQEPQRVLTRMERLIAEVSSFCVATDDELLGKFETFVFYITL